MFLIFSSLSIFIDSRRTSFIVVPATGTYLFIRHRGAFQHSLTGCVGITCSSSTSLCVSRIETPLLRASLTRFWWTGSLNISARQSHRIISYSPLCKIVLALSNYKINHDIASSSSMSVTELHSQPYFAWVLWTKSAPVPKRFQSLNCLWNGSNRQTVLTPLVWLTLPSTSGTTNNQVVIFTGLPK